MGDQFSALLVSLMALRLALVDQNPFLPCCLRYLYGYDLFYVLCYLI